VAGVEATSGQAGQPRGEAVHVEPWVWQSLGLRLGKQKRRRVSVVFGDAVGSATGEESRLLFPSSWREMAHSGRVRVARVSAGRARLGEVDHAPSLQPPFQWFGGKRRIAGRVWEALGDPEGYVEPFAGGAAVLLGRPRTLKKVVETVNDLDGWLVNFWRAMRDRPDEVRRHSGGPITEIDYHARLAWLEERRTDHLVSWLEGHPEMCDAKAAGWWLYVTCAAIGNPHGRRGPWELVDGRLLRTGGGSAGICRELPHLSGRAHGDRRLSFGGALAARLGDVRITCGDWERVTSPTVVFAGVGVNGVAGVYLDPPYALFSEVYNDAAASSGASAAVADWCRAVTDHDRLRVVLSGYDTEHDALLDVGWRKVATFHGKGRHKADVEHAEQLWLSPGCCQPAQPALFAV
jgi:site-specific DNA-adenine methylase